MKDFSDQKSGSQVIRETNWANSPSTRPVSAWEPQIFNGKLIYSVFLPVLIIGSIHFREVETSADNSAPDNNLLNNEHWKYPYKKIK